MDDKISFTYAGTENGAHWLKMETGLRFQPKSERGAYLLWK
ncbi:hypothetical protein [Bacillus massiliglaciei]|nr:hypothetical protein [Bacillus massiliglaciei]